MFGGHSADLPVSSIVCIYPPPHSRSHPTPGPGGLGGGRDGAGPGRAQQSTDWAMGKGALLKHRVLIISNEPG